MTTSPSALLASPTTLIVAAAVSFLALVILLLARRGRRVGETVFCRKCRFDLTGRPATSPRCPECGSELDKPKATITGKREPRRRLAWTAAVVLVPALLLTGILGYSRVKQVDWRRHLPVSMLLSEASGVPGPDATAAQFELYRRCLRNELSDDAWMRLIDAILVRQADVNQPWDGWWGDLFDAGTRWNRTTTAQRQQYYQTAVLTDSGNLHVRSTVLRGNDLPMELKPGRSRAGLSSVVYHTEVVEFRFDDGPGFKPERINHRFPEMDWRMTTVWPSTRVVQDVPTGLRSIPSEAMTGLSLGRHTVKLRFNITAYSPNVVGRFPQSSPPLPNAQPVAEFTFEKQAVFDYLASSTGPPLAIVDPARREAMRKAITIERVERVDKTIVIEYRVADNPPVKLPSVVVPNVSAGAVRLLLAKIDLLDDGLRITFGAHPSIKRVDVRFDFDPEDYAADVDDTPGWGEAIEFKNLEVKPGPATQATE